MIIRVAGVEQMEGKWEMGNKLKIKYDSPFFFLLLFFFFFGFSFTSQAKDMVQRFDKGKIDWTRGIITAWGEGVPPFATKDWRLAQELAKKTAILEAQKNLIEIIKAVRLDSKISIEDIVKSWDMAKESINKAVDVSSEIKTQVLPNGRAVATLELKIYGKLADDIYPFSPAAGKVQTVKVPSISQGEKIQPSKPSRESFFMRGVEKPSLKEKKSAGEGTAYTGIVIDARNLGIKPALFPKIFNEEGKLVYDYSKVGYSYAIKEGMVRYEVDLNNARWDERVKPHPLVLRAIGVKGDDFTDVVIKDSDIKKLLKEDRQGEFFKQGKVVIIVDR